MKYFFKKWFQIFKGAVSRFFQDNPWKHGAATAFFTIFSLPGMAIISITVASYFYEDTVVREQLITQIKLLMGDASAKQIEDLMGQAYISDAGIFLKVVGIGTLIFSATTVFVSLQDSLNYIWRIKPKPKKEAIKFILNRLLSLAMVVSLGFLILVSLLADTLITVLHDKVFTVLPDSTYFLAQSINLLISISLILLIFAVIYKVLPDATLKWRDVWIGAFITTLLFVAGKFGIGYYLGTSNLNDTYGAAGSLVLLLTWVYYSIIILLLGAQITYVHAKHMGRTILPNSNAVAIKLEEVERER
jgi:membrane protein